jgi:hypothetical protein
VTVVPLELAAIVPAAGGKLAKRPRLELVADAPAPTLPAARFPTCPRLAESCRREVRPNIRLGTLLSLVPQVTGFH